MHKVEFAKSFVKDMKSLPGEVQNIVLEKWVPKIQTTPNLGSFFRGKAAQNFMKISFRHKRNDYRIVYLIHKKEITIILLAIGSRENFYKKLKQRRLL